MPKYPPIKYTSRDYASIKNDLMDHIKRYYSDTYKDFNEASFGAMMLDSVAYIGDVLSFYLDYQANECFMDTAVQYENLIKLGRQNGYRHSAAASSQGVATLYALLPANDNGQGANMDYAPTMKAGSTFSTIDGNQFILVDSVNFNNLDNELVVAKVNSKTGQPTHYAVKTHGKVISGAYAEESIILGGFEKFRKVKVSGENISEIIAVVDSQGNEYHEVDYLSQNIVYKEVPNRSSDRSSAPAIIKAVPVARRFVVEQQAEDLFLQFGFGSESEMTSDSVIDPAELVLQQHGREHITDTSFDPNKLMSTDKFGVGPANTTLRILYRVNTIDNVNASTATLTQIGDPILEFNNVATLDASKVADVRNSLEVTNELPITGDISLPSSDEIRRRTIDTFATQNRIVTKQDYISYVYSMPPRFGAIKRCNVMQDLDSLKRNLNLYVISEGVNGKLTATSETIKKNLKTWINKNKMINDTIDILDAKVTNLGIEFVVTPESKENKFDIISNCTTEIAETFKTLPGIGESLHIADIYNAIRSVRGVMDVLDVRVVVKTGANYSDYLFDVDEHTSADGRYIEVPDRVVWEIKYPYLDIKGALK